MLFEMLFEMARENQTQTSGKNVRFVKDLVTNQQNVQIYKH